MTTSAERPPRAELAVLFAVSAAMLALEVLLVRLFEFSHWHHFAGLSISLALLGLGAAGSFLALRRQPRARDGVLAAGAAIQAGGTLALVLLHSQVALRPLFAAWDMRELARMLLVDFAAFVPFFGAGLVIGRVFARWPAAAGRVYAANLLGSGAGSVAASVLLAWTDVTAALALVAILPAVALPACVAPRARGPTLAVSALLCAGSAMLLLRPPDPAVSDFKALSQVMQPADARRIAARPGLPGRMSLVRSDSIRVAPGLSLDWTEPVAPADAVVIGSDQLVPMPRAFPGDAEHTAASLPGLPFALRPGGAALVLGASAWQSPLAAGDRSLVWVHADGRLLDLAARRGLSGPGVDLVEDGSYRYVSAAGGRRFSLVLLDGVFAGGDAASEDYLMTGRGLAAAMGRLDADGLLVMPLELSVPPQRFPRAMRTLREALLQYGDGAPARRVAVLRGLQEILVLASPRPLSDSDLARVRRFAEKWRFDLVWLPGMRPAEANRFHRLDAPVFHRSARAVLEGGPLPAAARWFATEPAAASRPYFWRSLSWSRAPDFVDALGHRRALSYLDWTLLLTAAGALVAAVLAAVLIVLPLGRLPAAAAGFGRGSVAVYFAGLGLGYMLLELVVFQRAILFLGEPVATASLVFAVFLVGSGIGSARAPTAAASGAVARVFLPIAAGLVLAWITLWPLAGVLLGFPWLPRAALLAAGLAPLTWAMGRAFPWALSRLAGQAQWVPWAWAINGFASVVAASLATLVSVQWGHPATLAAAVACYAVAALVAWRWTRSGSSPKAGGGASVGRI